MSLEETHAGGGMPDTNHREVAHGSKDDAGDCGGDNGDESPSRPEDTASCSELAPSCHAPTASDAVDVQPQSDTSPVPAPALIVADTDSAGSPPTHPPPSTAPHSQQSSTDPTPSVSTGAGSEVPLSLPPAPSSAAGDTPNPSSNAPPSQSDYDADHDHDTLESKPTTNTDPVDVSPPTLVSSHGPQDKRSKKNLRKEKIAAADASRDAGTGLLDAYTPAAPTQEDPQASVSPPPSEAQSVPVAAEEAAEPEDDWETQALKISDEDIQPEPQVRSLRPGGGSAAVKLGTNAKPPSRVVTYQYRKADLVRLRVPREQLQRPPGFFENIVVHGPHNQSVGRNAVGDSKSTLQQQHQQQFFQYYGGPSVDASRTKASMYASGQQQHLQSTEGGMGGPMGNDEGKPSWKRGQQGRRSRQPAPPMPRKVITDPMEAMSREVIAILNKITPQTFLKLTHKLADVEVSNSTMLEKLIQLVVDKAISEPTFSHLYAEMVSILDTANRYRSFFHIVWNRDSNQYFWIRDLPVWGALVGPFQTPTECIETSQAQILPMAVPVASPLLVELVVTSGVLVLVRTSLLSILCLALGSMANLQVVCIIW